MAKKIEKEEEKEEIKISSDHDSDCMLMQLLLERFALLRNKERVELLEYVVEFLLKNKEIKEIKSFGERKRVGFALAYKIKIKGRR